MIDDRDFNRFPRRLFMAPVHGTSSCRLFASLVRSADDVDTTVCCPIYDLVTRTMVSPPRHDRLSNRGNLRQILRLTLLLALVVVLMRSARNVTLYEPFFASDLSNAAEAVGVGQAVDGTAPSTVTAVARDASSDSATSASSVAAVLRSLQQVRDGTIFTAGDAAAYYGLLQLSAEGWPNTEPFFGSIATAPRIGVLPLTQQPDSYLHKMVRVSGQIARIETIRPRNRPEHYRLWIRPDRGAQRPIILATMKVPSSLIEQTDQNERLTNFPIDVAGVFFKRLAYQSGAGADLAPMLITAPIRTATIQTSTTPTGSTGRSSIASPNNAAALNDRPVLLGGLILLAILGGVIAAVAAMRTSKRDTDQVRRLRNHRDVNFDNLNASSANHP